MPRKAVASVIAVLGLLALAPIAQAGQIEAESYPATLSGQQIAGEPFEMEIEGIVITCATTTETGELAEASEVFSLQATYSKCTMFGSLSATVSTNGCEWVYHVGSTVSTDQFHATADLVCTGGNVVSAEGAGCKIHIKSQTGLTTARLDNNTAAFPDDIKEVRNLSGVKGEVTASSFPCTLKKGAITLNVRGSSTLTGGLFGIRVGH